MPSTKTEKTHQPAAPSTAAIMQALAPYANTIANTVAAYAVSTSIAAAFIANRAIQRQLATQHTNNLPTPIPSDPKWGKMANEHAASEEHTVTKAAAANNVVKLSNDRIAANAAFHTVKDKLNAEGTIPDPKFVEQISKGLVEEGNEYDATNLLFQGRTAFTGDTDVAEGSRKAFKTADEAKAALEEAKDRVVKITAENNGKQHQNTPKNGLVYMPNPTAKTEKLHRPAYTPSQDYSKGADSTPTPAPGK